MSPRGWAAVVAVVVVAAAGWWWWSGPERQIRRMLAEVAEAVNGQPSQSPFAPAAVATALYSCLDEQVVIEPGPPFDTITGRDAIIAAAMRLRATGPPLRIAFADVRSRLAADRRSATVDATVTATTEDRHGASQVDAREIVLTVVLVGNRWVIGHARAVPVLRRMS